MKLWEQIEKLPELARLGNCIPIKEIPEVLRKDIASFTYGCTMVKNDQGEPCYLVADFRSWLRKIYEKGLDYDIHAF